MEMMKIGDSVLWSGGWGRRAPKPAVVASIEITDIPGDAYGQPATFVPWDTVRTDDCVVVTLENGHWAYGFQLESVPATEKRS